MKLTAIDNATNNAYTAMRRVDQRPESATPVACVEADDADGTDVEWVSVCEDTLMRAPRFFIRTVTVGSGIAPDRPHSRVAGSGGHRYEPRLRRYRQ